MLVTISASAEARRRRERLPVGTGAECVPALFAAGHVLVHEHVDEARHPRADEGPGEEHRRQANLPEDVDLAHVREHAHLGAMRALVVALVGPQLEQSRALGRRRCGHFQARDIGEGGQERQLLPEVDRVGRRGVQVRIRGAHEGLVALETGLDRKEALERGRGRQHEERRRRQPRHHLEHANRRVAEPIERRDGSVLQESRRAAAAACRSSGCTVATRRTPAPPWLQSLGPRQPGSRRRSGAPRRGLRSESCVSARTRSVHQQVQGSRFRFKVPSRLFGATLTDPP